MYMHPLTHALAHSQPYIFDIWWHGIGFLTLTNCCQSIEYGSKATLTSLEDKSCWMASDNPSTYGMTIDIWFAVYPVREHERSYDILCSQSCKDSCWLSLPLESSIAPLPYKLCNKRWLRTTVNMHTVNLHTTNLLTVNLLTVNMHCQLEYYLFACVSGCICMGRHGCVCACMYLPLLFMWLN